MIIIDVTESLEDDHEELETAEESHLQQCKELVLSSLLSTDLANDFVDLVNIRLLQDNVEEFRVL